MRNLILLKRIHVNTFYFLFPLILHYHCQVYYPWFVLFGGKSETVCPENFLSFLFWHYLSTCNFHSTKNVVMCFYTTDVPFRLGVPKLRKSQMGYITPVVLGSLERGGIELARQPLPSWGSQSGEASNEPHKPDHLGVPKTKINPKIVLLPFRPPKTQGLSVHLLITHTWHPGLSFSRLMKKKLAVISKIDTTPRPKSCSVAI